MPVKMTLNKGLVPVKIYTDEIESSSLDQLEDISKLPFIHHHVAAMPDVHTGIGATIGSVIPMKGAIVPAAVGVDIGCGMTAVRLSLTANDLPDNLKPIRLAIEEMVPVGFDQHKIPQAPSSTIQLLDRGIEQIFDKHPGIMKMLKKPHHTWTGQLGTLGGGNHFTAVAQNLQLRAFHGLRVFFG
jgi:tRNA-splicing ligase RtcB